MSEVAKEILGDAEVVGVGLVIILGAAGVAAADDGLVQQVVAAQGDERAHRPAGGRPPAGPRGRDPAGRRALRSADADDLLGQRQLGEASSEVVVTGKFF